MINDRWFRLGDGYVTKQTRSEKKKCDTLVIGAGIAGICAAVAAARKGCNTILLSDRPVVGGNASSECRITINGVNKLDRSVPVERETGIVEELQIENWYYNPQESYPMFDHVLLDFVTKQKNLTVLLNTYACDVTVTDNSITEVIVRQLSTEKTFEIKAKSIIDSSGDGLIAALAGA